MEKDIVHTLRDFASEFDKHLDRFLVFKGSPPELVEAMRYAALAPGKRIRPYVLVQCCELVGGLRKDAWPAAAAIECIHAFSLVHDDLPALDNDDFRRGQPTAHKKFGEAIAILAGDALLTYAFDLIAARVTEPDGAQAMIRVLAQHTGCYGMIGGEAQDLLSENSPPSHSLAKAIHDQKTASLFVAACKIGAIAGGATQVQIGSLGTYGFHLGLAFQIADDLLDVTATTVELGKSAGKDARAGKQSFPACVGMEASRVALRDKVEAAIMTLEIFGPEADPLREIVRFAGSRNF